MNGKTILVAIGLLLGLHASATTFYVDVNNPAPLAPYTNWPAAATNIQDAIDAATNGDLVLVTNGIYQTGGFPVNGSSLTSRIALTKPLIVQSVHGPAVTVIQGYQVPGTTTGDSAVRCAYLTNGASLVGFTLAGGATRTDQFGQPENVASAILADVEPWLPARRKGRHPSVNTRRMRS